MSHPAAARRCCGFAALGPAARRYRSIAARPALSSDRTPLLLLQAVPCCQLTKEAGNGVVCCKSNFFASQRITVGPSGAPL